MATEIRVPALGESVTEATVGQWFKTVGDTVAVDEPLVELETDKITLEVPAPTAGVIAAIEAEGGATVEVGGLLGTINADGAAATAAGKARPSTTGRPDEKTETTTPIGAASEETTERQPAKPGRSRELPSPAARQII